MFRIRIFLCFVTLLSTFATLFAQSTMKDFSVEELFGTSTFNEAGFQGGRWANTGPVVRYIVYKREDHTTDIMQFNLQNNDRIIELDGSKLVAPDTQKNIRIESYSVSNDGKTILLFTDSERVWRQNTKGYYYLYHTETQQIQPLSKRALGLQLFAKFSPDASKVAFVRNRNIILADLASGTETQLTFDGATDAIINGTFDWVYEEEFGMRDGWEWSPDGKYIAFFKLDESQTKNFEMADLRGQYPVSVQFRYPKAGEQNSEIKIGVIDVATGKVQYFDTQTWDAGGDTYEYLPRMGWTSDAQGQSQVWLFRMNRNQNVLDLMYGNPESGLLTTILHEEEPTWISLRNGKINFLKDQKHFVWLSEKDGYNHIYLYQNDGTYIKQLTSGNWEVTTFHGVDEVNQVMYITATKESPLERHLYKISLSDGSISRITKEAGWHDIEMSADLQYYVDTFSDSNTPPFVALFNQQGDFVRMLEGNERLKESLASYTYVQPEFLRIPIENGESLNAYLLKPSNFNPNKTYPLLLHVYGGPNSQEVRNAWGGTERLWHTMLAEKYGVLVAGIDNRGTGGRGKAFKGSVYKQLGILEAKDQIAGANYFASLPYVNKNQIGIWGWSYGGYLTLMSLLSEGGTLFKVGMAVAPVTDWRLYDTIYTERYMSTPQSNENGYIQGAPLLLANNLKEHQKLLLVHGDADDNVHYQNTVQMIEALQNEQKKFDMMIYPGSNHGIFGGNARIHLYNLLTDYLLKNLKN